MYSDPLPPPLIHPSLLGSICGPHFSVATCLYIKSMDNFCPVQCLFQVLAGPVYGRLLWQQTFAISQRFLVSKRESSILKTKCVRSLGQERSYCLPAQHPEKCGPGHHHASNGSPRKNPNAGRNPITIFICQVGSCVP